MDTYVRKCTCAPESDSDSDGESDPRDTRSSLSRRGSSRASSCSSSSDASSGSPREFSRRTSGVGDSITTSMALHHSESLRRTHALQNVFCACYDTETVLMLIQRREPGSVQPFSPVQRMLLERENITSVFRCATTGRHDQADDLSATASSSSASPPAERYRRAYIATEIIVRFYLKAIAWHGAPRPTDVEFARQQQQQQQQPSPHTSSLESLSSSPVKLSGLMSYSSLKISAHKHISNLRKLSFGSNSGSFQEENESEVNAAVRGYIVRLDELTAVEWKRIFVGLYAFLARPMLSSDENATVDSVMVTNMCRVTKNFVIYPSVHALIMGLEFDSKESSFFAQLTRYTYNPDISSMMLGLIHLAQRRKHQLLPLVRVLVAQLADSTRPSRSVSMASTVSVSSTMSAYGAYSPLPSPLSHSSSTYPAVFSVKNPLQHARISGCVDILVKILTQQFPNTFRYYIQTRLQLASFENVGVFERELFPNRKTPNDKALHEEIQEAVLTALIESKELLMNIAELGLAELRYLDAYHRNGAGIPSLLIIDVLKHSVDCSLSNKERMQLFVAPMQSLIDTLCAAINYHQHLSTITEFASRDCFSDSDSEESVEDEDDHSSRNSSVNSSPVGLESEPTVLPLKRQTSRKVKKQESDDSFLYLRSTFVSPVIGISPLSGKEVVNHRPLSSVLLVTHVVDLLDSLIRMGKESIDNRLTRMELSASLIDIFERFPKANILHCRLVRLFLNLFDRKTSNDRVNNPLLRAVFRPPDSILAFVMHKLNRSSSTHPYDAHLAIIGVKIDKICSAPTLQQELILQYCSSMQGWAEFSSSLVASHYQQIDALDDSVLALRAMNKTANEQQVRRRGSDNTDDVFPLGKRESSACDFLSGELEPFRRLPMEQEGFGSAANLAMGNESVHPTDMFRSRTQSQYPQSIIEILRADTSTLFDITEDEHFLSGYAYQKKSKWVKVHLKFEKDTCELIVQEVAAASTSGASAASPAKAPSTSKFKQFLMAHTQQWSMRPRKSFVFNARKWIAFGRSVKNPGVGAFGFQVEIFDRSREVDRTLTFVTRSEMTRTQWFETMQQCVMQTRTLRQNSLSGDEEDANVMLVQCVATKREGMNMTYLVIPSVHLLGPVVATSFFLKSEVPEEIPFWGTFQGVPGINKYASLFARCLTVVSVSEKKIFASGYSVIVEFDATVRAAAPTATADGSPTNQHAADVTVTCSCTDSYLISGNQIIGLTRTMADSEKLVKLLCEEDQY